METIHNVVGTLAVVIANASRHRTRIRVPAIRYHSRIYKSGVLAPKEIELLSIAFDASYTHMYAPVTRRHVKAALKAGATMEEIMEVLKLCVVQGVQACNLGVPVLAEELERNPASQKGRV